MESGEIIVNKSKGDKKSPEIFANEIVVWRKCDEAKK